MSVPGRHLPPEPSLMLGQASNSVVPPRPIPSNVYKCTLLWESSPFLYVLDTMQAWRCTRSLVPGLVVAGTTFTTLALGDNLQTLLTNLDAGQLAKVQGL